MQLRVLALWFLATVASLSCSQIRPNVRADIASAGFVELESDHFVLTTDLDEDKAADFLAAIEERWQGLILVYQLLATDRPGPSSKVRFVHLADCKDYWRFGPTKSRGFATESLDFENRRMIITCGRKYGTAVQTHELAHIFNNHLFRGGPRWLNEGLATYVESFKVKETVVSLGNPAPVDRFKKVPKDLRVTELLELNGRSFYVGGRRNYRGAWKLIHLLVAKYPKRFRGFFGLLIEGFPHRLAWKKNFGDIPADVLQREFNAHLSGPQKYARDWPIARPQPSSTSPATLRRLGPGEANAVWAMLRLLRARHLKEKSQRRAVVDALAQIDAGAKGEPGWVGRDFWRAAVLVHFPKAGIGLGDPVALLRSHLERAPADASARLGLVSTQMQALIASDHDTGDEVVGLDEVESDVRELIAVASSGEQLRAIGRYYGLRGQSKTGYNFVVRALKEEPSCARCYETLAMLSFKLGKYAEALGLQIVSMEVGAERDLPGFERRKRAFERYRVRFEASK